MIERRTNNEREFKRAQFVYTVGQLEIVRQAIAGNDDKPVATFITRDGEPGYDLWDHEFLNAISGGVNKLYRQLEKLGEKEFADHVLQTVIKDDV